MGDFRPEALRDLLDGLSYVETGQSFILSCPRCNKAKKLYIRKHDGRFVCWHCKSDGFRGRPEFALRELLSIPFREIQEQLYGEVQVQSVSEVIWDLHTEEEVKIVEPLKVVGFPLDFYPIGHTKAFRGQQYLESRGISPGLAKSYQLHYSPTQRRVIFPVNKGSELYGWQGRTIDNESWVDERTNKKITIPKALTSEGLQKDRVVFGWDRLQDSDHAVITEGPIDCIKAHLCGGNVATFGKAVSQAQLQLILASGVKRIYLGLDPDAMAETRNLIRELGEYELYELQPAPGFKDLGEMSCEGVYRQFENAPRLYNTMRFHLNR